MAAKTVYVQKKSSSRGGSSGIGVVYTSPHRPERGNSEQKRQEGFKTKYLTEGKDSSLNTSAKHRNKILSVYSSKKHSLKGSSHEKPTSIEEPKKKSTSIYSAAASKKNSLLAKYLHRPVRLA